MNRRNLIWAGLLFILSSALCRAAVNAETLPGWDADPTRMNIAIIGLGPTGSLVLDMCAWLGAAMVFAFSKRHSRMDPLAILGVLGALLILVRTFVFDAQNPDAIRIASSWAAAWAGFAAVLTQAHRPLVRSVLGSIVLCFVLYLTMKALVQVYVEHPALLAQFEANKAESLAAQGYEPGSAQALMYERRLRHPDPTGWFGLSNVMAGFFAAGAIGLGHVGFRLQKSARLIALSGAGGALFCLLLTGSKAGLGVFLIGAFVLLAARFFPRKLVPLAVLGAVLVPPAAVIVRGLTNVPASELSLLVRWFYMQGAARLAGDSFPIGVGPTGFQDAYALVKPIGATEDVTSPHMIWLDWSSTLGAFAIPVIIALAWVVWRFVRGLQHPCAFPTISPRRMRLSRNLVILAIIPPVMLGAWLEMQATPIENAVARLLGVIAWGGLAMLLIRAGQPSTRALIGAALVLLMHSELDMLMTLPGSTPLVLVTLALAAPLPTLPRLRVPARLVAVCPVLALVALSVTTSKMWNWESLLRTSSTRLGDLVDRRVVLTDRQASRQEWAALQVEFVRSGEASLDELSRAIEMMPDDERVVHAAARLGLTLDDSAAVVVPAPVETFVKESDRLLSESIEAAPSASLHAHRARVLLRWRELLSAEAESAEMADELLDRAIEDLRRAAALSPQAAIHPAALAITLHEAGRSEQARDWALEALRRDEFSLLDPLAGLSEELVRRLERIARSP